MTSPRTLCLILLVSHFGFANLRADEPTPADREAPAAEAPAVAEKSTPKATATEDAVLEKIDQLLEARLKRLEARVEALEGTVGDVWREQNDLSVAVGEITVDSDGQRLLRSEAIQAALPKVGEVVIRNNMDAPYYLNINGVRRFVPAKTERKYDVPTGTLTTELVGYEPPKNWVIGVGNNFQQIVEINPTPPGHTTYRPVYNSDSTTVVNSPVVAQPPVVYEYPVYQTYYYVWP
jgi:hypothetical protein